MLLLVCFSQPVRFTHAHARSLLTSAILFNLSDDIVYIYKKLSYILHVSNCQCGINKCHLLLYMYRYRIKQDEINLAL
jgi:hypothetical protein